MPQIQIQGIARPMFLIPYDADGHEQTARPSDPLTSQQAVAALGDGSVTDVFLISHGWNADYPAAVQQYTRSAQAMVACTADIANIMTARPGFSPLLIGFHWPSLAFADDELGGTTVGAADFGLLDLVSLVDDYAARIVGTATAAVSQARDAIGTIVSAAAQNLLPTSLPQDVVSAYNKLNQVASLAGSGDPAAPPDTDRLPFDPEAYYQKARQAIAALGDDLSTLGEGDKILGGVLAPLRVLSFWKMKDRALRIGQTPGAGLLSSLQAAQPGVRFHLMGHSFGCIVVSAMLTGNPVHTLFLCQGALSLWSYATSIPFLTVPPGKPGFFNPLITGTKVAGPIVTTQSVHDLAVGLWYPLAAGVAGEVSLDASTTASPPEFGGVGTWGIQGLSSGIVAQTMLPLGQSYGFQPGTIYNVESSQIINATGSIAGAHNDIAHPEVAHAFWEAATS